NDVYSGFLSQESEIAVQKSREELKELRFAYRFKKGLYNENEKFEGILTTRLIVVS
ncbi:15849_t:CDS:2, partial [Funneliformis caledonium]